MTPENLQVHRLAKKFGYRKYMIERYLELFQEETKAFLEGNDTLLSKSLRVNELVTSPATVEERLTRKGIELEPIAELPYAFRILTSPRPVGATTEYLLGQYMLQSPASMWAVEALNPRKAGIVVDMCAAPGGKATHLAQLMRNEGVLLATDINRSRIRSLRSNLSRMRVENALVIRMDAAQLPELDIQADAVLLDAPCTGEGLIPLDPTRKRSRSLQDISKLAVIQQKLILAAIALLREGGVLVYSTCSFAPEENEFIIDFALRERSIRIIDTGLLIGDPAFTAPFGKELDKSLTRARRFYPYKHKMEGFFICKMIKVAA